MTLFFTGDGESADTIICALELPDNDWFKRALIEALTLMCDESNWSVRGTASTDFARDKACEMNETLELNVIIPTLPIGTIAQWAMTTPPAQWLICNAQSVLRASYPALFAILGTTYGAVDGTHFTLPDFKDYSPMGAGTTVAMGAAAGTNLQAIAPNQMPTHNHAIIDPGHNHQQQIGSLPAYTATGSSGRTASGVLATNSLIRVVTDNQTTGITTGNAGASVPLSMLHPVKGVHFIIYAGI